MTSLRSRLRGRLADDRGFSMVVTLGAMSMLLLTSAAAMNAVRADLPQANDDRARKSAFAAAEAGLQVYLHKLQADGGYWAQCSVPADGVNVNWNKPAVPNGTADPQQWLDDRDSRVWKNVSNLDLPGEETLPAAVMSQYSSAYTIETLPANGAAQCNTTNPDETVVDAATGTFRVRITGRAVRKTGASTYERYGAKRSLIATFKRRSFLDFIYFTDLEVLDPSTYPSSLAKNMDTLEDSGRNPNSPFNRRTIDQWGASACGQYAYAQGEGNRLRKDQQFDGQRKTGTTTWTNWNVGCQEIQFITGDRVQGPLHTNDSMLICGRPQFGRKPLDIVESSAPGDGRSGQAGNNPATSWRAASGGSCSPVSPNVNIAGRAVANNSWGTYRYGTDKIILPPSNSSLADEAPDAYTFLGTTRIELRGATMRVTGRNRLGQVFNNTDIPFPPDGVAYVQNRTDTAQGPLCTRGYQAADPYGDISGDRRTGCGIAEVFGNYSQGLTIGAEDDILLWAPITRPTTSIGLLGLVANNFIRVRHPVTSPTACRDDESTNNATGSMNNALFQAALLTVTHSFLVDNWGCGGDLGTLTVDGAIAQKFRGPVGRGSAGYEKNYIYDDRLKLRSPPKFLDPVQAAWRLKTYQEQAPAQ